MDPFSIPSQSFLAVCLPRGDSQEKQGNGWKLGTLQHETQISAIAFKGFRRHNTVNLISELREFDFRYATLFMLNTPVGNTRLWQLQDEVYGLHSCLACHWCQCGQSWVFSFCRVIYRPSYRTTLEGIWCGRKSRGLCLFFYCKWMSLLLLNAVEFIACVLHAVKYPLSSSATVW